MPIINCSAEIVAHTISALRASGASGKEGIVLWLSKRLEDKIEVAQAYVPIHHAREDMFHIPPIGMRKLQARLREHRWFVGAQVHSHPEHAFHSRADDKWAIVRHAGALSVVAPFFASGLTTDTFLNTCAVFELTAANRWRQLPGADIASHCIIT